MNNCIKCNKNDSTKRFIKSGWEFPGVAGFHRLYMKYHELPVCWECFKDLKSNVESHWRLAKWGEFSAQN